MLQKLTIFALIVVAAVAVSACAMFGNRQTRQPSTVHTLTPVEIVPSALLSPLPTITVTLAPSLPLAAVNRPGWTAYTVPDVITFAYPTDWELRIDLPATPADYTGFELRPSATTGLDPYMARIMGGSRVVSKAEEATLYPQAGISYTVQGNGAPTIFFTWNKSINLNGNDWYLYISGQSNHGVQWDDLHYLADKGALTQGHITAVHYLEAREQAFTIGREFDREMLIALDERGGMRCSQNTYPSSLVYLNRLSLLSKIF